jgi:hypothetical protein
MRPFPGERLGNQEAKSLVGRASVPVTPGGQGRPPYRYLLVSYFSLCSRKSAPFILLSRTLPCPG